MTKQAIQLSIHLAIAVGVVASAHAATLTASSCADTAVQSAINSAANGDTVAVPAGTCTWGNTVSISNKGITLKGAGIGQTTITDQGSGGAALNIGGASAANFVDVSGFTFIKSTDHNGGMIQVSGTLFAVAFRIHHLRIVMATSGSRGIYPGNVYGLIDHVTFDVTATAGSIQTVSVDGSSIGSDGGFTPWMQPLTLGTNKAVYIEDNTFNYGSTAEDCIDAYSGARLVVRHNAFNNAHIGFHGTDSGSIRSPFSFEIYSNIFTNNTTGTFRAGTIRGGTGVWYNNTYGGSHGTWYGVTMMNYRACPPVSSSWQTCDGTNWQLGSKDFSSNGSRGTSTNGGVKFCSIHRDTVCTSDADCSGGGGTCSTYFDGSGPGGYACRDQVGRTHDQALSPIYAWNNGSVDIGSYDGGSACGLGLNNYILAGRDYVDGTPMPGYTAYSYPHPLQGGSVPPPPPPPTGSACDINGDSATNVSDVQLCANQAIGAAACTTGDINKDSSCNVIDVQRVVNAALGGQCVTQ